MSIGWLQQPAVTVYLSARRIGERRSSDVAPSKDSPRRAPASTVYGVTLRPCECFVPRVSRQRPCAYRLSVLFRYTNTGNMPGSWLNIFPASDTPPKSPGDHGPSDFEGGRLGVTGSESTPADTPAAVASDTNVLCAREDTPALAVLWGQAK